MFGGALPDVAEHGEMMANAQHAFSLTRDLVARLHDRSRGAKARREIELDALFVWSTEHGLASILESDAGATLEIPDAVLERVGAHAMDRVGRALDEDG